MIIRDEQKRRWLLYAAALIIICIAGYFIWQGFHKLRPVTPMSQQQAETPAGVELAAKNVHIAMLQGQLEEAAKQVEEYKNKPPDKIVVTEVKETIKVVERERAAVGADFAMVTDPAHPEKQADLKEIEKLPAGTAVTLNQYNVFAYRKKFQQIELTPDWAELAQGKLKLDEAGYTINKRITKTGKYLGFKVAYNLKHEEAKGSVVYAF